MTAEHMDRGVKALERIAMALAAMYAEQLKDLDQPAKAKRLSHLGFSNVQIASALGTTANSVNVSLHRARKRPKASQRSRRERKQ